MNKGVSHPLKVFVTFLCGVYFLNNCVLAASPEINFWKERRKNFDQSQNDAPVQLAQLPANLTSALNSTPLDKTSSLAQLKNLGSVVKPALLKSMSPADLDLLSPIVHALPTTDGSIRKINLPVTRNGKVIVHIQDVHANTEAQQHIASALTHLSAENLVNTLALEGAEGPIRIEGFRSYPHQNAVREAFDYLLDHKKMAGPMYAATKSDADFSVQGIDDSTYYEANVKAYLDTRAQIGKAKKDLGAWGEKLASQKKSIFNPDLLKLEQQRFAFEHGELPLGDYIKVLASHDSFPSFALQAFMQALQLEKTLDFNRVGKERTTLITSLVNNLSAEESQNLLQHSVAFKAGQVSRTDFYSYLQATAKNHNIDLKKFQAMNSYIQYVLLSDSVDIEKLFIDIRSLEEKTFASLIKTDEERTLAKESQVFLLAEKLVDFSLTREEWDLYKNLKSDAHKFLAFEKFYESADYRDVAMSKNIVSLMAEKGNKVGVVVTGGFHSTGMDRSLQRAGFTVVSFTPTLTHVDAAAGSSYLSVFEQEKAPLSTLFDGNKLFLSENPKDSLPLAVMSIVGVTAHANPIMASQAQELTRKLSAAMADDVSVSISDEGNTVEVKSGSALTILTWANAKLSNIRSGKSGLNLGGRGLAPIVATLTAFYASMQMSQAATLAVSIYSSSTDVLLLVGFVLAVLFYRSNVFGVKLMLSSALSRAKSAVRGIPILPRKGTMRNMLLLGLSVGALLTLAYVFLPILHAMTLAAMPVNYVHGFNGIALWALVLQLGALGFNFSANVAIPLILVYLVVRVILDTFFPQFKDWVKTWNKNNDDNARLESDGSDFSYHVRRLPVSLAMTLFNFGFKSINDYYAVFQTNMRSTHYDQKNWFEKLLERRFLALGNHRLVQILLAPFFVTISIFVSRSVLYLYSHFGRMVLTQGLSLLLASFIPDSAGHIHALNSILSFNLYDLYAFVVHGSGATLASSAIQAGGIFGAWVSVWSPFGIASSYMLQLTMNFVRYTGKQINGRYESALASRLTKKQTKAAANSESQDVADTITLNSGEKVWIWMASFAFGLFKGLGDLLLPMHKDSEGKRKFGFAPVLESYTLNGQKLQHSLFRSGLDAFLKLDGVHWVGLEIAVLVSMSNFFGLLQNSPTFEKYNVLHQIVTKIEGNPNDPRYQSVLGAANPIFDTFKIVGIDVENLGTLNQRLHVEAARELEANAAKNRARAPQSTNAAPNIQPNAPAGTRVEIGPPPPPPNRVVPPTSNTTNAPPTRIPGHTPSVGAVVSALAIPRDLQYMGRVANKILNDASPFNNPPFSVASQRLPSGQDLSTRWLQRLEDEKAPRGPQGPPSAYDRDAPLRRLKMYTDINTPGGPLARAHNNILRDHIFEPYQDISDMKTLLDLSEQGRIQLYRWPAAGEKPDYLGRGKMIKNVDELEKIQSEKSDIESKVMAFMIGDDGHPYKLEFGANIANVLVNMEKQYLSGVEYEVEVLKYLSVAGNPDGAIVFKDRLGNPVRNEGIDPTLSEDKKYNAFVAQRLIQLPISFRESAEKHGGVLKSIDKKAAKELEKKTSRADLKKHSLVPFLIGDDGSLVPVYGYRYATTEDKGVRPGTLIEIKGDDLYNPRIKADKLLLKMRHGKFIDPTKPDTDGGPETYDESFFAKNMKDKQYGESLFGLYAFNKESRNLIRSRRVAVAGLFVEAAKLGVSFGVPIDYQGLVMRGLDFSFHTTIGVFSAVFKEESTWDPMPERMDKKYEEFVVAYLKANDEPLDPARIAAIKDHLKKSPAIEKILKKSKQERLHAWIEYWIQGADIAARTYNAASFTFGKKTQFVGDKVVPPTTPTSTDPDDNTGGGTVTPGDVKHDEFIYKDLFKMPTGAAWSGAVSLTYYLFGTHDETRPNIDPDGKPVKTGITTPNSAPIGLGLDMPPLIMRWYRERDERNGEQVAQAVNDVVNEGFKFFVGGFPTANIAKLLALNENINERNGFAYSTKLAFDVKSKKPLAYKMLDMVKSVTGLSRNSYKELTEQEFKNKYESIPIGFEVDKVTGAYSPFPIYYGIDRKTGEQRLIRFGKYGIEKNLAQNKKDLRDFESYLESKQTGGYVLNYHGDSKDFIEAKVGKQKQQKEQKEKDTAKRKKLLPLDSPKGAYYLMNPSKKATAPKEAQIQSQPPVKAQPPVTVPAVDKDQPRDGDHVFVTDTTAGGVGKAVAQFRKLMSDIPQGKDPSKEFVYVDKRKFSQVTYRDNKTGQLVDVVLIPGIKQVQEKIERLNKDIGNAGDLKNIIENGGYLELDEYGNFIQIVKGIPAVDDILSEFYDLDYDEQVDIMNGGWVMKSKKNNHTYSLEFGINKPYVRTRENKQTGELERRTFLNGLLREVRTDNVVTQFDYDNRGVIQAVRNYNPYTGKIMSSGTKVSEYFPLDPKTKDADNNMNPVDSLKKQQRDSKRVKVDLKMHNFETGQDEIHTYGKYTFPEKYKLPGRETWLDFDSKTGRPTAALTIATDNKGNLLRDKNGQLVVKNDASIVYDKATNTTTKVSRDWSDGSVTTEVTAEPFTKMMNGQVVDHRSGSMLLEKKVVRSDGSTTRDVFSPRGSPADFFLNIHSGRWMPLHIDSYMNGEIIKRDDVDYQNITGLPYDSNGHVTYRSQSLHRLPPDTLDNLLPNFLITPQYRITNEIYKTMTTDGQTYAIESPSMWNPNPRDPRIQQQGRNERIYFHVEEQRAIRHFTGEDFLVKKKVVLRSDYTPQPDGTKGKPVLVYSTDFNPYDVDLKLTAVKQTEANIVTFVPLNGRAVSPMPESVKSLLKLNNKQIPAGTSPLWEQTWYRNMGAKATDARGNDQGMVRIDAKENQDEITLYQYRQVKIKTGDVVETSEAAQISYGKDAAGSGRLYMPSANPALAYELSDPATGNVPDGLEFSRKDLLTTALWKSRGFPMGAVDPDTDNVAVLIETRAGDRRIEYRNVQDMAATTESHLIAANLAPIHGTDVKGREVKNMLGFVWDPVMWRYVGSDYSIHQDGARRESWHLQLDADFHPRSTAPGETTYEVQQFRLGTGNPTRQSIRTFDYSGLAYGEKDPQKNLWSFFDLNPARLIRNVGGQEMLIPSNDYAWDGSARSDRVAEYRVNFTLSKGGRVTQSNVDRSILKAHPVEDEKGNVATYLPGTWDTFQYELAPNDMVGAFGDFVGPLRIRTQTKGVGANTGTRIPRFEVQSFFGDDNPANALLMLSNFPKTLTRETGRTLSSYGTSEAGNVVSDILADGSLREIGTTVNIGVDALPGRAEPFFHVITAPLGASSVHFWYDDLGRQKASQRADKIAINDTPTFLHHTYDWSGNSWLYEFIPPNYTPKKGNSPLLPTLPEHISTQSSDAATNSVFATRFMFDARPTSLLRSSIDHPSDRTGRPDIQEIISYRDEVGRLVAQTQNAGLRHREFEQVSFFPQWNGHTTSELRPNQTIPKGWDTQAPQNETPDFLYFFLEANQPVNIEQVEVEVVNEQGVVLTTLKIDKTNQNAAEAGLWQPEFNDPLIFNDGKGRMKLMDVTPMRSLGRLFPVGKNPRSVFIPMVWLREKLGTTTANINTLNFRIKNPTPGMRSTKIERLGDRTTEVWHHDKEIQQKRFPLGTAVPTIPQLDQRIVDLGNDQVIVVRGFGTKIQTIFYEHGVPVTQSYWVKNASRYEQVVVHFVNTASPFLHLPDYVQSYFSGSLARLIMISQFESGQQVIQVNNINSSVAANNTFVENPFREGPIQYLPFQTYNAHAHDPEVDANIFMTGVNRFLKWVRGKSSNDDFPDLTKSGVVQEVINPFNINKALDAMRPNLPPDFQSYPLPKNENPIVGAAQLTGDAKENLLRSTWENRIATSKTAWVQAVLASQKENFATKIPATRPAGTPGELFADAADLALIMEGLLEVGEISAAENIANFIAEVTRDGQNPVSAGYHVKNKLGAEFSDEYNQPNRSKPRSGATAAMSSAILELAKKTGRNEYWLLAARLHERAMEFAPQNDFLDVKKSPDELAVKFLKLWRGIVKTRIIDIFQTAQNELKKETAANAGQFRTHAIDSLVVLLGEDPILRRQIETLITPNFITADGVPPLLAEQLMNQLPNHKLFGDNLSPNILNEVTKDGILQSVFTDVRNYFRPTNTEFFAWRWAKQGATFVFDGVNSVIEWANPVLSRVGVVHVTQEPGLLRPAVNAGLVNDISKLIDLTQRTISTRPLSSKEIREQFLKDLSQRLDISDRPILLSYLQKIMESAGGLGEFEPQDPVYWPSIGVTSIRPDQFDLTTNFRTLRLLKKFNEALNSSPETRRGVDQQFRSDVAHQYQLWQSWFDHVIFPVVDKYNGIAPMIWRQQAWVFGVTHTGLEGIIHPYIIVAEKQMSLRASLASAEAYLTVNNNSPDAKEKVSGWLREMMLAFGASYESASGPTRSGMDYMPASLPRAEGRVFSGELTAEFGKLSALTGFQEGQTFARNSLLGFFDPATGLVREASISPDQHISEKEGVITGDNHRIFAQAGQTNMFNPSLPGTLATLQFGAAVQPSGAVQTVQTAEQQRKQAEDFKKSVDGVRGLYPTALRSNTTSELFSRFILEQDRKLNELLVGNWSALNKARLTVFNPDDWKNFSDLGFIGQAALAFKMALLSTTLAVMVHSANKLMNMFANRQLVVGFVLDLTKTAFMFFAIGYIPYFLIISTVGFNPWLVAVTIVYVTLFFIPLMTSMLWRSLHRVYVNNMVLTRRRNESDPSKRIWPKELGTIAFDRFQIKILGMKQNEMGTWVFQRPEGSKFEPGKAMGSAETDAFEPLRYINDYMVEFVRRTDPNLKNIPLSQLTYDDFETNITQRSKAFLTNVETLIKDLGEAYRLNLRDTSDATLWDLTLLYTGQVFADLRHVMINLEKNPNEEQIAAATKKIKNILNGAGRSTPDKDFRVFNYKAIKKYAADRHLESINPFFLKLIDYWPTVAIAMVAFPFIFMATGASPTAVYTAIFSHLFSGSAMVLLPQVGFVLLLVGVAGVIFSMWSFKVGQPHTKEEFKSGRKKIVLGMLFLGIAGIVLLTPSLPALLIPGVHMAGWANGIGFGILLWPLVLISAFGLEILALYFSNFSFLRQVVRYHVGPVNEIGSKRTVIFYLTHLATFVTITWVMAFTTAPFFENFLSKSFVPFVWSTNMLSSVPFTLVAALLLGLFIAQLKKIQEIHAPNATLFKWGAKAFVILAVAGFFFQELSPAGGFFIGGFIFQIALALNMPALFNKILGLTSIAREAGRKKNLVALAKDIVLAYGLAWLISFTLGSGSIVQVVLIGIAQMGLVVFALALGHPAMAPLMVIAGIGWIFPWAGTTVFGFIFVFLFFVAFISRWVYRLLARRMESIQANGTKPEDLAHVPDRSFHIWITGGQPMGSAGVNEDITKAATDFRKNLHERDLQVVANEYAQLAIDENSSTVQGLSREQVISALLFLFKRVKNVDGFDPAKIWIRGSSVWSTFDDDVRAKKVLAVDSQDEVDQLLKGLEIFNAGTDFLTKNPSEILNHAGMVKTNAGAAHLSYYKNVVLRLGLGSGQRVFIDSNGNPLDEGTMVRALNTLFLREAQMKVSLMGEDQIFVEKPNTSPSEIQIKLEGAGLLFRVKSEDEARMLRLGLELHNEIVTAAYPGSSQRDTVLFAVQLAKTIKAGGTSKKFVLWLQANKYSPTEGSEPYSLIKDAKAKSEYEQRTLLAKYVTIISGIDAQVSYNWTEAASKSLTQNAGTNPPTLAFVNDRNNKTFYLRTLYKTMLRSMTDPSLVAQLAARTTSNTQHTVGRMLDLCEYGNSMQLQSWIGDWGGYIGERIGIGWFSVLNLANERVRNDFADPITDYRFDSENAPKGVRGFLAKYFAPFVSPRNFQHISEDLLGVVMNAEQMNSRGEQPTIALHLAYGDRLREFAEMIENSGSAPRWAGGGPDGQIGAGILPQRVMSLGNSSLMMKRLQRNRGDFYGLAGLALINILATPILIRMGFIPFAGVLIVLWFYGLWANQVLTLNGLASYIRRLGFNEGFSQWLRERYTDTLAFSIRGFIELAGILEATMRGTYYAFEFMISGGAIEMDRYTNVFQPIVPSKNNTFVFYWMIGTGIGGTILNLWAICSLDSLNVIMLYPSLIYCAGMIVGAYVYNHRKGPGKSFLNWKNWVPRLLGVGFTYLMFCLMSYGRSSHFSASPEMILLGGLIMALGSGLIILVFPDKDLRVNVGRTEKDAPLSGLDRKFVLDRLALLGVVIEDVESKNIQYLLSRYHQELFNSDDPNVLRAKIKKLDPKAVIPTFVVDGKDLNHNVKLKQMLLEKAGPGKDQIFTLYRQLTHNKGLFYAYIFLGLLIAVAISSRSSWSLVGMGVGALNTVVPFIKAWKLRRWYKQDLDKYAPAPTETLAARAVASTIKVKNPDTPEEVNRKEVLEFMRGSFMRSVIVSTVGFIFFLPVVSPALAQFMVGNLPLNINYAQFVSVVSIVVLGLLALIANAAIENSRMEKRLHQRKLRLQKEFERNRYDMDPLMVGVIQTLFRGYDRYIQNKGLHMAEDLLNEVQRAFRHRKNASRYLFSPPRWYDKPFVVAIKLKKTVKKMLGAKPAPVTNDADDNSSDFERQRTNPEIQTALRNGEAIILKGSDFRTMNIAALREKVLADLPLRLQSPAYLESVFAALEIFQLSVLDSQRIFNQQMSDKILTRPAQPQYNESKAGTAQWLDDMNYIVLINAKVDVFGRSVRAHASAKRNNISLHMNTVMANEPLDVAELLAHELGDIYEEQHRDNRSTADVEARGRVKQKSNELSNNIRLRHLILATLSAKETEALGLATLTKKLANKNLAERNSAVEELVRQYDVKDYAKTPLQYFYRAAVQKGVWSGAEKSEFDLGKKSSDGTAYGHVVPVLGQLKSILANKGSAQREQFLGELANAIANHPTEHAFVFVMSPDDEALMKELQGDLAALKVPANFVIGNKGMVQLHDANQDVELILSELDNVLKGNAIVQRLLNGRTIQLISSEDVVLNSDTLSTNSPFTNAQILLLNEFLRMVKVENRNIKMMDRLARILQVQA